MLALEVSSFRGLHPVIRVKRGQKGHLLTRSYRYFYLPKSFGGNVKDHVPVNERHRIGDRSVHRTDVLGHAVGGYLKDRLVIEAARLDVGKDRAPVPVISQQVECPAVAVLKGNVSLYLLPDHGRFGQSQ